MLVHVDSCQLTPDGLIIRPLRAPTSPVTLPLASLRLVRTHRLGHSGWLFATLACSSLFAIFGSLVSLSPTSRPFLAGVAVFFGALALGCMGAWGFIPETRVVLRNEEEKVVLVGRGRMTARILEDVAAGLSSNIGGSVVALERTQ